MNRVKLTPEIAQKRRERYNRKICPAYQYALNEVRIRIYRDIREDIPNIELEPIEEQMLNMIDKYVSAMKSKNKMPRSCRNQQSTRHACYFKS